MTQTSEARVNKDIYMLTISCSQKKAYVDKNDIDDVLDWLYHGAGAVVLHGAYELHGKYYQLHWHGLVYVNKGFRWKPWMRYGNREYDCLTFHILWKRHRGAWGSALDYIYKMNPTRNSIRQAQILLENYYRHHINFCKLRHPYLKAGACVMLPRSPNSPCL